MRRLAIMVLAALSLFLLPAASPSRASNLAVSTRQDGVQLTLSAPRLNYPRDALILLSLTVDNRSHQEIFVPGPFCFTENPRVEVLDASGSPLYPPALTQFVPPPCPLTRLDRNGLAPGHTLHRKVYAVLRAGKVRAVLMLGQPHGSHTIGMTLITPGLDLQLSPSEPPVATLYTGSNGTSLDFPPADRANGPVLYEDSARCPTSPASGSATELHPQNLNWVEAPDDHIEPGCSRPLAWHVVAGRLNQPVTTVDYVAPREP